MAEINIGQISEALNNKADLDLNNTNPFADYVVEWQIPTSENNYTWYRLYKSGWVEQGGVTNQYQVTFPKAFSDTHYTVTATPVVHSGSTGSNDVQYLNKSTTTIEIRIRWEGQYASAENDERCWRAEGMTAQS